MKLVFPTPEIVTVSDPEVPLDPDQAPEAEHEVALDDDQVNVESEPIRTEFGLAEKFTLGAGTLGVGSDPPPPPPPHAVIKSRVKNKVEDLIFKKINCVLILHVYFQKKSTYWWSQGGSNP